MQHLDLLLDSKIFATKPALDGLMERCIQPMTKVYKLQKVKATYYLAKAYKVQTSELPQVFLHSMQTLKKADSRTFEPA